MTKSLSRKKQTKYCEKNERASHLKRKMSWNPNLKALWLFVTICKRNTMEANKAVSRGSKGFPGGTSGEKTNKQTKHKTIQETEETQVGF